MLFIEFQKYAVINLEYFITNTLMLVNLRKKITITFYISHLIWNGSMLDWKSIDTSFRERGWIYWHVNWYGSIVSNFSYL